MLYSSLKGMFSFRMLDTFSIRMGTCFGSPVGRFKRYAKHWARGVSKLFHRNFHNVRISRAERNAPREISMSNKCAYIDFPRKWAYKNSTRKKRKGELYRRKSPNGTSRLPIRMDPNVEFYA